MKKVRIKIQNMRRGDVFVADCDGSCCIVERPRTNMGKEYQAKHRKTLRLQRKQLQPASVDSIMQQLSLMGM